MDEQRFRDLVLADPTVTAVLDRAGELELPDADLFYFSDDLSWSAEDAVIRRAGDVFAGSPVPVEVRNEARVHLWYAERFDSPAPHPFTGCRDAIDHFAAVCCCVGMSVATGEVYAPHGFDDLAGLVVRPNPGPAPRHVYEAKAARWQAEWPELTVLPWTPGGPRVAGAG